VPERAVCAGSLASARTVRQSQLRSPPLRHQSLATDVLFLSVRPSVGPSSSEEEKLRTGRRRRRWSYCRASSPATSSRPVVVSRLRRHGGRSLSAPPPASVPTTRRFSSRRRHERRLVTAPTDFCFVSLGAEQMNVRAVD